jgi:16S rRNA (guanine527-N7)-methyltransferase
MASQKSSCREAILELPAWTGSLGIELTTRQLETLVRYCDLILQANTSVNLTAIATPEGVAQRHFLDSLTIGLALRPEDGGAPLRLVDIGSGGGLPGLAIAIGYPRWSITLLESIAKKARFLDEAVRQLNLRNVTVVCERAENLGRSSSRDYYDIACARAVAALPALVEYSGPLVKAGGRIILFKSGEVAGEVDEAGRALNELNCRVASVVQIPESLPVGRSHCLVVLEKLGATPSRYPRRVGVATTRPL